MNVLLLNPTGLSFVHENIAHIVGQRLDVLPHIYQSGHNFGRKVRIVK